MYCTNCGKEIDDKAVVCVHCGVATAKQTEQSKSWLVTLLLCLFLGTLGLHRFYVNKTGSGIVMILLTITFYGWFISALWALIDFIAILCGSFKTKDGQELQR